jgi:hypothetical protein
MKQLSMFELVAEEKHQPEKNETHIVPEHPPISQVPWEVALARKGYYFITLVGEIGRFKGAWFGDANKPLSPTGGYSWTYLTIDQMQDLSGFNLQWMRRKKRV